MSGLLEVHDLAVSLDTMQGEVQAVRGVSFCVRPGEVLAIVGESGCGKSVLLKSILKLLPSYARIKSGRIAVNGTDLTGLREREMCRLRGSLCSMVFQDPMTSLHPALPIGVQIGEAVSIHQPGISKTRLRKRVLELMRLVGIREPEAYVGRYPHHLSGGMRQRCVLAAALAAEPAVLLADEPTTALDVLLEAQILGLLRDVGKSRGMAVVLVTHDLGAAAGAADRIAVMYAGKIIETGTAEEIFYDPRHPYTQGLLQALPSFAKSGEPLKTIPGMPPSLLHPPKGDAFACRNPYALAVDYEKEPPMFRITDTHAAATWLLDARAADITVPAYRQTEPAAITDPGTKAGTEILLDVRHVTHRYAWSPKHAVYAVDDVSFQIYKGEIFGLVGESGCGKSTVARCIMNICRPTGGSIYYKGLNVCDRRIFRKNKRMLQTARQIIFQDSASSLNQRMKVCDLICEPLKIQHRTTARGSYRAEAEFQMRYVGLDAADLDKYPSELSGGQRQRVAVARALVMESELLVVDEPIASLDVSVQAQIVNLFRHLQKEHGFSFLFIAHDLAMVAYLCDRIGVMYQGKLVECAPTEELFAHPRHPYTKALLAAVPLPDPRKKRAVPPMAYRLDDRSYPDGKWMESTNCASGKGSCHEPT